MISVTQPGLIYHPPPHGIPFGQIPIVTTPGSIPPRHPVPVQLPVNQPHLIPVNYVVPNGAAVPPQQPPNHVLGKGVQNDMNHILNPKMPLPGNFTYCFIFLLFLFDDCLYVRFGFL